MHRSLLLAGAAALSSLALSCAPVESTPGPGDEVSVRAPLTDIVGLPVAEDLDPADDVVEYELAVASAEQELVPGQMTSMWTFNGTSRTA